MWSFSGSLRGCNLVFLSLAIPVYLCSRRLTFWQRCEKKYPSVRPSVAPTSSSQNSPQDLGRLVGLRTARLHSLVQPDGRGSTHSFVLQPIPQIHSIDGGDGNGPPSLPPSSLPPSLGRGRSVLLKGICSAAAVARLSCLSIPFHWISCFALQGYPSPSLSPSPFHSASPDASTEKKDAALPPAPARRRYASAY